MGRGNHLRKLCILIHFGFVQCKITFAILFFPPFPVEYRNRMQYETVPLSYFATKHRYRENHLPSFFSGSQFPSSDHIPFYVGLENEAGKRVTGKLTTRKKKKKEGR